MYEEAKFFFGVVGKIYADRFDAARLSENELYVLSLFTLGVVLHVRFDHLGWILEDEQLTVTDVSDGQQVLAELTLHTRRPASPARSPLAAGHITSPVRTRSSGALVMPGAL